MYDIIDAHSHIFPAKIASKATEATGTFYGLKMSVDYGTSDTLLHLSKQAGISRSVVHSTATTTKQVRSINNFILNESLMHTEFIPFMTLHPDMSECEINSELDFGVANGFKGIKLHPDIQGFAIDEERAEKIYRCVGDKLPILFHTGDKRYNYSNPFRLASIAKKNPSLTVIGAHFGGFSEWDKISCYKGLKNIYFDTSSSLAFLSATEAVDIIRTFGAEWFLFGTDYPMWNPIEEVNRFLSLPLNESERKAILSQNIMRLLKL